MKPSQLLVVLLLIILIVLAGCAAHDDLTCTFITSHHYNSSDSVSKTIDAELIRAGDVAGKYAYIGVENELLILNVTNPSNVTQVGELYLSSGIESLNVLGEYVYIRGGNVTNEHHIVDVTNALQPQEVRCQEGSTIPSLVEGVFAGGFAYIPDQEDGSLKIYEIGQGNISRVASYQSFVPARVRLLPDPKIIASEPRIVLDVAVVKEYVYVAENRVVAEEGYFHDGQVRVLDVSNPSQPRSVGLYEVPEETAILRLIASNNSLVVSTGGGPTAATRILDISEPKKPTEIEMVQSPELLLDVVDGYVLLKYIDGGIPGIRVRQLADITKPVDWDESSYVYAMATDVAIAGNYAYFVGGGPAMAILNVADPLNPILAGTFRYSPEDGTE